MTMQEQSLRDCFLNLPVETRRARLEQYSEEQLASLRHSWEWVRRPSQALPGGDWTYWLIKAGRGWGKTRTGAESVREWVRQGFGLVNLIGATADDARDIMIEGESGILAVCSRNER